MKPMAFFLAAGSLALTDCKLQPAISPDVAVGGNKIVPTSQEKSLRLMTYVEKFVKTPCSLKMFVEDVAFRAILTEPGNVGPGGLSIGAIELKANESLFVLQPPYMAENFDAIYFIASERIGLRDLLIAFENAEASEVRIVNALVSSSTERTGREALIPVKPRELLNY